MTTDAPHLRLYECCGNYIQEENDQNSKTEIERGGIYETIQCCKTAAKT